MDVVIYQGGKVASVAIKKALEAQGLVVRHAHYLGLRGIKTELGNFLHEYPANTYTQDLTPLFDNIQTTQMLRKRKDMGQRTKIISGVRDPLGWYVSNIIQNFDAFYARIFSWCESNSYLDREDITGNISAFIDCMYTHFCIWRTTIGTPEFLDEINNDPHITRAYDEIRAQCDNLSRGISKLDDLLPVTGLDIFSEPFLGSCQTYRTEFYDIFIYKYEHLSECLPAMARFLGLEELSLERVDVTSNKPQSHHVEKAFKETGVPVAVLGNVYSSRFCRHFGYEAMSPATDGVSACA